MKMLLSSALIAFLIASIWNLIALMRELIFYRGVGWNFKVDNPGSSKNWFYDEGNRETDRASNKERVLLGRPIFVIGCTVFAIVLAYATGLLA